MANNIEWVDLRSETWDYSEIPGDFEADGSQNDGPAIAIGGVVLEGGSREKVIEVLEDILKHVKSLPALKEPHAVMLGNPVDGVRLAGPFDSADEAVEWGSDQAQDTWAIIPIESVDS